MEKIRLGRTGMMVTKVGLGGIPIQRISEDEAVSIVRKCIGVGINFIDTANMYTTSEERIGKAIAGQRDELILATKSASRGASGIGQHLELSLKQLGVDYIDLYQFHGINDIGSYNQILGPDGPMAVIEEARRQGVVKHIGITSHSMDVAKEAVRSERFDTIMFPFNFVTCEPAYELVPLSREHDVGFIAMKPLAGGRLQNARIAFKYLLQFPDIVLIPGIQRLHEVEAIVQALEGPSQMTEAEELEMDRLKQQLGTRFCRRCDYCQPCPEGIPISLVMEMEAIVKTSPAEILVWDWVGDGLAKAGNCTKCGECEERCPYGLPIREMLEEYAKLYQAAKRKYQEQAISR